MVSKVRSIHSEARRNAGLTIKYKFDDEPIEQLAEQPGKDTCENHGVTEVVELLYSNVYGSKPVIGEMDGNTKSR